MMERKLWQFQLSATGSVGSSIDVTPSETDSMKVLLELDVLAPNANENSVVDVYKDSVAVGNKIVGTTYLLSCPDGRLCIPGGGSCVTKWIVVVTGGSGSVYVNAKYR